MGKQNVAFGTELRITFITLRMVYYLHQLGHVGMHHNYDADVIRLAALDRIFEDSGGGILTRKSCNMKQNGSNKGNFIPRSETQFLSRF